ncbi:MAG: hypothetical protein ABIQ35_13960 [Verrucomicrobiota bacterium]
MNPTESIPTAAEVDAKLVSYINVKLALLGCQLVATHSKSEFTEIAASLIARYREKERLLANHLSPPDQRIQSFLFDYFQECAIGTLPTRTFVLDRPGLARTLSLPFDRDEFISDIVSSYRVQQGVLHNPKSDRRTTQGIFHVTEGGLPIPNDKVAVPSSVFAKLWSLALTPPPELMRLPFTTTQPVPAECFVSLLIRPLVCPAVPGFTAEKSMEIRFFVPGGLVSNLDFVESIFGNAGDPYLPENDAGLDVEHWTAHTGCVVLAPHLVGQTKKSLGLPHWDKATERQRRDSMCWKNESDFYNNGEAFKLTCRDESGVIVTIIADNYFGYCKKEVKTQISYSANLFGLCEEEHAGGALVFTSYDLGEEFTGNVHVRALGHSFTEMVSLYDSLMDVSPEGFAVDQKFPDIIYVPEHAGFDLHQQKVSWPKKDGSRGSTKLLPNKTYVRPSGYKVQMEKPNGRAWRLVGTVAEGTLCHKPSTVSGGGKSEISKPITDAIIQGPVFVADFKKDFQRVAELLRHDYSKRFNGRKKKKDTRVVLSPERSLGSVIKLLTPDARDYTPEYNAWLDAIPQNIKELVFVVKRFYKAKWGQDWLHHFSVDIINGTPGNELKCDNRKLVTNYLRVGYEQDGSWRVFGLRKDFQPATKLQMEDDITASVVVPLSALPNCPPTTGATSVKFVQNCEQRLFQRPDEAIHRGYDRQTESDFAQAGNFFSNYEPLDVTNARNFVEDAIGFAQFTEPMQNVISGAATNSPPAFFVCSANPRLVDGKPTKNPRYLQIRPDLLTPRESYLAQMATRLQRRLPLNQAVYTPVNVVLPGRRNNPPEPKIRPLAVFNPIHYFELPELFMEFICSMTGKSPSTTGAGSEGALTKSPFNALPPIIDLNNALVAWLLTGHSGFVTAAGFVGPHSRVDHDVSLLVPEIWCRMSEEERSAKFLIENNYLEPCKDFDHDAKRVLASRLGFRINERFVRTFFSRVFNHPAAVVTDEMLRPETQDMAVFADGMENIVTTQKRVAQMYFDDGSIACACPPLQALLHIMVHENFEGKGLQHSEIRNLFTCESLLASDWYAARLKAKQSVDYQLWLRHIRTLENFLKRANYTEEAARLGISTRLEFARKNFTEVESPAYLQRLRGTLGAEPIANYLNPSSATPV